MCISVHSQQQFINSLKLLFLSRSINIFNERLSLTPYRITSPHPQMLPALLELVRFEGNEFYITTDVHPLLFGVEFKELQLAFPKCIPVGIKRSASGGGGILLKPPPNAKFEEGDGLVLLADDETGLQPDLAVLQQLQPKARQRSREVNSPSVLTKTGPLVHSGPSRLSAVTGHTNNVADHQEETDPEECLSPWWDRAESASALHERVERMRSHSGPSIQSEPSASRLSAASDDSNKFANDEEETDPEKSLIPWWDRAATSAWQQRIGRISLHSHNEGLSRNSRRGSDGGQEGIGEEADDEEEYSDDEDEEDQEDQDDADHGSGGDVVQLSGAEALIPWWDRQTPAIVRHAAGCQRQLRKVMALQTGLGQFSGRFLVLGWCRDMAGLIQLFGEAVTKPSELWLYSPVPLERREFLLKRVSVGS